MEYQRLAERTEPIGMPNPACVAYEAYRRYMHESGQTEFYYLTWDALRDEQKRAWWAVVHANIRGLPVIDYEAESAKTEAMDIVGQTQRIAGNTKLLCLLHAGLGLASEGGEFASCIKSHLFYGKPLDETNLIEELGDLEWFSAQARRALGITREQVLQRNVAKLRKRHGDKFSADGAINRDIAAEREILEGKEVA